MVSEILMFLHKDREHFFLIMGNTEEVIVCFRAYYYRVFVCILLSQIKNHLTVRRDEIRINILHLRDFDSMYKQDCAARKLLAQHRQSAEIEIHSIE